MNLNDMKVTGTGVINITDSKNLPLLGLKISLNNETTIPEENNLIIYVDKEENESTNRKQYVFNLESKLNYTNNLSDEFIIKPSFSSSSMEMISFVKRYIANDDSNIFEIENLEYQTIELFEGINYISTNYGNASIEVIYPKDSDLTTNFVTSSMFYEYFLKESENLLNSLYFKDAFTNTIDGISIDANNLNINCITSKNNKFSLDSEGNLTVNSITSISNSNMGVSVNDIYPVGSIYMNVISISPQTLFGGVWEQITDDAYLKIVSSNGGSLGGTSTEHKIPLTSMPTHGHTFGTWYNGASGNATTVEGWGTKKQEKTHATNSMGGGEPYYPYYLGVYVWKRTA